MQALERAINTKLTATDSLFQEVDSTSVTNSNITSLDESESSVCKHESVKSGTIINDESKASIY